jgi:magnesium chelatase subunit H
MIADAYTAARASPMAWTARPSAGRLLLQAALKDVDLAYQNLESVELGVTTIDHYFDTLGGISRAVKRPRAARKLPVSSSATRPAARARCAP